MLALGRVFRPIKPLPLSVETLTAQEMQWLLRYKRDRVGSQSPAQVRAEMISVFGAGRAVELVAVFERAAIPARPGEWRRRMH